MDIQYLEEVKKLLHNIEYTIIGKDVTRVDSFNKVTGLAKYTADFILQNALVIRPVRSPHPHAWVKKVDKVEALRVPGVEIVITAGDIPGVNDVGYLIQDQPLITEKVRYIGDIVALVVARDEKAAWEGYKKLKIEYEKLPAIFTPDEALVSDLRIHDRGNIVMDVRVRKGNAEQAFNRCDLIVERTYKAGTQDHAFLEPEAAVAIPTGNNEVKVIGTTQMPFLVRNIIARILGAKVSNITVLTPYIGGAFGGKGSYSLMICGMVAIAAAMTQKPVRIVYSRHESFAYRFKRGKFAINYKSGATKDGKLKAVSVEYFVDAGAYAGSTPGFTRRAAYHATGPYEVENVNVDGVAVYTNNLPNSGFNGFGNPQMLFAAESQMDILAEELGMDPIEFRLKNSLKLGSRTGTNQLLEDSVGVRELIEKVALKCNWEKKRVKNTKSCGATKRRGIGVGCSWHGCGTTGTREDWAGASVIVNNDGSVTFSSGLVELGQGTTTSHAMMIAEVLGIPLEWVRIESNNTGFNPDSGTTSAQRGTMIVGTAIVDASLKLRKKLNKIASELLSCEDKQIAIENGEVYNISGSSQKISFKDLTFEMYRRGIAPGEYGFIKAKRGYPDPQTGQGNAYSAYTFACTVAEVEVDLETGYVDVLRLNPGVAAGKIIQPSVVKGQVLGCSILGLGYALKERVLTKNGEIMTRSYTDYLIPTIKDKPEIADIVCVEDEYKYSAFGAKGVGEIAIIATPPAILNAIYNATGIRFYELPLDQEKIYFALKEKTIAKGRN